jgi:hypothetical protein
MISVTIKNYYYYRFLIINDLNRIPEGFVMYLINPSNRKFRNYSRSFFPIVTSSKYKESHKAKKVANFFLIMIYLLLMFILGFVVTKYFGLHD